jgi:hypothetical protein
MAIDFPASPTLNQTFSSGNVNYVWDGTKWTASVTGGISLDKIEEGNTKAEVVDTGSDGRFVVTTEGTERLRVDSNGDVTINDKIIHSGDTNTAIRFPAADIVSVETNGSERARIDSSGRLLIGTSSANGNGGVLQLSGGITFPATQVASTDPNTLDDYEEGTWTPILGTYPSGTATMSVQEGWYVKIGKIVQFSAQVVWTAYGTWSGNTLISGLPFASRNNNGGYSWPCSVVISSTLTTTPMVFAIEANTSQGFIKSALDLVQIANTNFPSSGRVTINGTYQVP